ncbi:hypothetical protein [Mycolicibacterium elephantis]|uniref:hypothetical protein n=1 Tax=Mycolicibacterium elephantis TaxID=81858 RepID=UPI001F4E8A41|nr:hypothetical protein [Mycolicibacterium elephantis]
MFGGVGLWSGGGAISANAALDKRIADIQAVKGKLDASEQLYRDSVISVTSAKNGIIDNVDLAHELIDIILRADGLESEKKSAVDAVVESTRNENLDIVALAASHVSGKASPSIDSINGTAGNESQLGAAADTSATRVVLVSHLSGVGGDELKTTPPVLTRTPPPNALPADGALAGVGGKEVHTNLPPKVPAEDYGPVPSRSGLSGVGGDEVVADPSPPIPPEAGPGAPIAVAPVAPVVPSTPGASVAPSAPSVGTSASPLSGTSAPSTSTSSPPITSNPAAAAANQQTQLAEFQRSMADAAAKTAAQTSIPPPQPAAAPIEAAPTAQPLNAPLVADTPTATPPPAPTSPAGASAGVTAPAPVTPAPGSGAAPGGAVPLGPPPTPPPAAPATPATAGPSVAPAAAAAGSSTVGAPAPVPVSAARAQREAIAAATLRRPSATDPVQVAHRIAAALNVGINDIGFFWITGLAKDGTIVVANNYGLGYIPEGVNLPDPVKMASADESIPATIRGTWATYPILALHGWAQHHNTELRAVIATEDQFKGFDPGAPKIVLRPDDIPQSGEMKGRRRLQVIAADAATRLAAISGGGLSDVLPPAPTDTEAPQDQRAELWFEVFRPLLSNAPDRGQVQLAAFVTYAEHAQELALHDAHIATDEASQRAAIADWIYWQHLSVLSADAIAASASV